MASPSIISDAWSRKEKGLCPTPNCGYQVHAGHEFCTNCLIDIDAKGTHTGEAWEHYQQLKTALEARRILKELVVKEEEDGAGSVRD